MSKGWTVLILAGQRPGVDPLAAHFGQQWKALVPLHGEAMLTYVIKTLRESPDIARIIVLTQDADVLAPAIHAAGGVDSVLLSQSSISASIAAVAGSADAPWPLLVTTADHPLLTPDMVAQFLRDANGADLAVGMVEKLKMVSAFPDNQRTWLKFSDGHWSGANLFALSSARVMPALQLWAQAEQDRKKPWKLFRHFGIGLMIRALTRSIGLADALAQAGRRLGLAAKLVAMDDPVAAIDVDKPADHALADEILRQRQLAQRGNSQ